MAEFETLTDAELVAALHAGEQAAFNEIYDRYADRVYSFHLTLLQDEEEAARATRGTFVAAASDLGELDEGEPFRPWLFARARGQSRANGRSGHPPLSGETAPDDLRHQVWDAIDDLGERERVLMHLHLVEGLDGEELGSATGVDPDSVDNLTARMRRRVEGALGALLIARLGSPDCPQIDEVLDDTDREYDAKVRATVNRHIGGCEHCQERRQSLLAPTTALPGILLVTAPEKLRAEVLGIVAGILPQPEPEPEPEAETEPAPVPVPATPPPMAPPIPPDRPEPPAGGVFAPVPRDEGGDLVKLGVFLAVTLVLGLIGFAVSARFDPLEVPVVSEPQPEAAPGDSTTTTTTAGSEATTTTVGGESSTTSIPAAPASIELGSTSIDLGESGTTGEFEVRNTGGQAGAVVLASSNEAIALSAGEVEVGPGAAETVQVSLDRGAMAEGDIAETIAVTWEGGGAEVEVVGSHEDNPVLHNPQASPDELQVDGGAACTGTQSTVSVRVRDTSPLGSVVARWNDGSSSRETAMSDVGAEIYEGVIGPFNAAQTAEVRIVAFDERGNAGGAVISINVLPCP